MIQTFEGIELVPTDASCWVSWGEGIKSLFSTVRYPLKTSFHCLISFTYVTFLFHGLCLLLLLVYPDVDPVLFVLDLHREYTAEWSLFICILYGLLSCDTSPICKKCCCIFAHCYTLDDDSERPIDCILFSPIFLPMHKWDMYIRIYIWHVHVCLHACMYVCMYVCMCFFSWWAGFMYVIHVMAVCNRY